MTAFYIDPDIRKASTLDASFYNAPENFILSKEKIFARTWQLIGDTDDLKLSGQLLPHTLLPGFLDEPVLLVRDKSDQLHCLSNVCTHRGNLLVENPCTDNQIRCRYHGRRFELNGTFKHMPEFDQVENFPGPNDHLNKVPFHIWEKFVFAGIAPSITIEQAIGEMMKRVSFLPLHELKHDKVKSRDYLVKAHWALYCENYLEGFHIPFIHHDLNAVLDYGAYHTELFKYSNVQVGIAKGGEDVFDIPKDSPDYGKQISAYYFWIFPNIMFNFYTWGLSINIVKPLGPALTKVSFLTYVYRNGDNDHSAGALLDKVEREDEAIVETVQKGINSRFYRGGRYAPKRETGTHHFHQLLAQFMNT